ncbi:hypothetical protein ruthe_02978 [Rubellimicrobium thermophilum DSM 16684]|uniref:Uncharacterized protein n=1 Tax=Rubellimicrobium thermophilum DSM 16684 TaxID=1123069 RepID=S9QTR9_9RHOB|nr:hypothetical protein [Rubellimicrobium thermophilum]EPX83033.1 hypothetical protein ruthe_02978 [Rubellimicrobium thermophilum DSM 16684]
MNRRVAFPFLTLSDSAVEASAWEISLDGAEWSAAGEFLPHWDSASDIRVRRTLRLNLELAASDLGIPADRLAAVASVRIGTGQGRLPRQVLSRTRRELRSGDTSWEFEKTIEGRQLSMVLDLQTEFLLANAPSEASALSPVHPGDRLWSENIRVRLEGEEPRFPIETVDLAQMLGGGIAGAAPWHLHWSPGDWTRDFHGAVRLYLNAKSGETLQRIEDEDPVTIQFLLGDVMSQICERFLADPEAETMMDAAEPGSLGAQAATWLRKAWPGKDASFIRSVLESRPGAFRSTMLALAEPGVPE